MRRLLLSLAAACLALILGLRHRDHASRPIVDKAAASHESQPLTSIAAPTRPFAGFVVDEKGRAIAGANVCARVEGSFLSDAERAAVCVHSADDGLFTFSTPPRVLRLVASAPGYLPRTTVVEDLEHPASIALSHGGAKIGGKIVDLLGRPVANARIESEGATDVLTDGDGVYELWTAAGVASLHVSADGYADRDLESFAPSEGNDLTLEWGSTIVGHARPHAWVSTYSEGTGEKSVRADDSGAFRIGGLASGKYVLEARSPGNYGRFATVTLGVGDVSDEIEIPFEPARDVAVRFASCTSGRVMLVPDRPHAMLTATSLVSGSARILSVLRGPYVVRVECDGGIVATPRSIVVGESDLDLSFEPAEGMPVSGVVVVEGSGAALPFATVVARGKDHVFAHTTADAKGSFRFAALPPARYVLTAEHADALEASVTVIVRAAAVDDVRLELDGGGMLQGRTVDADGHPVSGLRVEAGGRFTRSGADGRFTLLHVPLGETMVNATRGDKTLRSDSVTIERDRTATLELVVEAENLALEGRVEDENGAPVVEALVEMGVSHGVPSMRALTDANGHFAFAHLADATYLVRVSRRGRGTIDETIHPGDSATLVLAPAASIVGTALGASGSNVWLRCSSTHESTWIRKDGTFVFEDIAAGTCTLDFNVAGTSEKRTISLKSGEIARPSFHFEQVKGESSTPSVE